MGDLVRYRLCFRLFGRKPDPLHVEMTLHQFHHSQEGGERGTGINREKLPSCRLTASFR
jgi:hypothetical protein